MSSTTLTSENLLDRWTRFHLSVLLYGTPEIAESMDKMYDLQRQALAVRDQFLQSLANPPTLEDISQFHRNLFFEKFPVQDKKLSPFLTQVWQEILEDPSNELLSDFLNKKQMISKHSLVQALVDSQEQILTSTGLPSLGQILIVGGWYGALANLMLDFYDLPIDRILSIDLDNEATKMAAKLQRDKIHSGQFRAVTLDAMDVTYQPLEYEFLDGNKQTRKEPFEPDIIINTSCEHFPDFQTWYERIPHGKVLMLQSNDYFQCEEHCNCSEDIEAFKKSAPMTRLFHQSTKPFKKFSRFLLIGVK